MLMAAKPSSEGPRTQCRSRPLPPMRFLRWLLSVYRADNDVHGVISKYNVLIDLTEHDDEGRRDADHHAASVLEVDG
jgi:hypothetical protein